MELSRGSETTDEDYMPKGFLRERLVANMWLFYSIRTTCWTSGRVGHDIE